MLAYRVGNHDGPMPAARATDRNGQIGLAFLFELGKEEVDKIINMIQKRARGFVRVHVLDYIRVCARIRFEVRNKVRIGKKPNVKDQIGIDGYAVLKAETHKRDQKVLGLSFFKLPYCMLAQLMDRKP